MSIFNSIPLIYVPIFVLVPCCGCYYGLIIQREIRYGDTFCSILFDQDFVGYLMCIYVIFWVDFSISVNNGIGIFIGIALNLQIDFGKKVY